MAWLGDRNRSVLLLQEYDGPRRGTAPGWWNLSLVVQHSIDLESRNEGVSLGTLVYDQLVAVPRRLPDVAHLYLFGGGSLYRVDPGRASVSP